MKHEVPASQASGADSAAAPAIVLPTGPEKGRFRDGGHAAELPGARGGSEAGGRGGAEAFELFFFALEVGGFGGVPAAADGLVKRDDAAERIRLAADEAVLLLVE